MKAIKNGIIILLILTIKQNLVAQGFVNLNFENATFISDPSSLFYPSAVYASDAIPGWTAYVGEASLTDVLSNNVSLSGESVSIIGTNWGYPQLQGQYSILLAGANDPGVTANTAIGQTGQIPITTKSIIYWGLAENTLQITFNGHLLSFNAINNTANYTVYGADISSFAGQTGELLFTALPSEGFGLIDNIQFLTTPVPEPSVFSLSALGSLLFVWRRRRNQLNLF